MIGNKPKKILVIEDERPIAKALELKLTNSGYDVIVRFDGRSGMDELSKQVFDLIILDLMMPKMNGFQVLTEMNALGIKIPTLVASNLSISEDIRKVKELGATDYFIKSNTPLTTLIQKIKDILQG